MILKRVDVLPHGLINNVETKLGWRGEKTNRIFRLAQRKGKNIRRGRIFTNFSHRCIWNYRYSI